MSVEAEEEESTTHTEIIEMFDNTGNNEEMMEVEVEAAGEQLVEGEGSNGAARHVLDIIDDEYARIVAEDSETTNITHSPPKNDTLSEKVAQEEGECDEEESANHELNPFMLSNTMLSLTYGPFCDEEDDADAGAELLNKLLNSLIVPIPEIKEENVVEEEISGTETETDDQLTEPLPLDKSEPAPTELNKQEEEQPPPEIEMAVADLKNCISEEGSDSPTSDDQEDGDDDENMTPKEAISLFNIIRQSYGDELTSDLLNIDVDDDIWEEEPQLPPPPLETINPSDSSGSSSSSSNSSTELSSSDDDDEDLKNMKLTYPTSSIMNMLSLLGVPDTEITVEMASCIGESAMEELTKVVTLASIISGGDCEKEAGICVKHLTKADQLMNSTNGKIITAGGNASILKLPEYDYLADGGVQRKNIVISTSQPDNISRVETYQELMEPPLFEIQRRNFFTDQKSSSESESSEDTGARSSESEELLGKEDDVNGRDTNSPLTKTANAILDDCLAAILMKNEIEEDNDNTECTDQQDETCQNEQNSTDEDSESESSEDKEEEEEEENDQHGQDDQEENDQEVKEENPSLVAEWIDYLTLFVKTFMKLDEDNIDNNNEEAGETVETSNLGLSEAIYDFIEDIEGNGISPAFSVICDFFNDILDDKYSLQGSESESTSQSQPPMPISMSKLHTILHVFEAVLRNRNSGGLSSSQLQQMFEVLISMVEISPPVELHKHLVSVFRMALLALQKLKDDNLVLTICWICEFINKTLDFITNTCFHNWNTKSRQLNLALLLANELEFFGCRFAEKFNWHLDLLNIIKATNFLRQVNSVQFLNTSPASSEHLNVTEEQQQEIATTTTTEVTEEAGQQQVLKRKGSDDSLENSEVVVAKKSRTASGETGATGDESDCTDSSAPAPCSDISKSQDVKAENKSMEEPIPNSSNDNIVNGNEANPANCELEKPKENDDNKQKTADQLQSEENISICEKCRQSYRVQEQTSIAGISWHDVEISILIFFRNFFPNYKNIVQHEIMSNIYEHLEQYFGETLSMYLNYPNVISSVKRQLKKTKHVVDKEKEKKQLRKQLLRKLIKFTNNKQVFASSARATARIPRPQVHQ